MTHLESVRCLWSLAAVGCVEAVAERPETPRDGLSLVSAGDLNSLHPRPGVPLLLLLLLMLLVVPGPAPASSQALPAQTADLPSGLIVSKHCLVFAASTPADTGHRPPPEAPERSRLRHPLAQPPKKHERTHRPHRAALATPDNPPAGPLAG